MKKWFVVLVALQLTPFIMRAEVKVEERLAAAMRQLPDDREVFVWVYFTDKGSHELQKNSIPGNVVSERALHRRMRTLGQSSLVDYADLPLDTSYVRAIAHGVLRIRHELKWFNAVSAVATKAQVNNLVELPFVREIGLVARFAKNRTEDLQAGAPLLLGRSTGGPDQLDYGLSQNQMSIINVPPLHNAGNFGQGVLVGVFDNGFRLLTHEVFDSLRGRIVATYDFVDKKTSVVPNNPAFGSHGVNVLSIIGGYKPGKIIGPAFGAGYILARTENDSSETPIEEDNWAAAIQWAESLGVDVTSTSLGYLEFEPPYRSWTWQDMNGRTTMISRAATMAARRGVVVVNSAGNEGFNAAHNTLNAPADADSIIAVGAVDPNGSRVQFSSVGPTTDGRIKPDVMAQGSSVYVADAYDPAGYGGGSGTSYACPAVAGVAALLLKSKPSATPMDIINALRNTASRTNAPDNLFGWGIIDALAASNYLQAQLPLAYFRGSVLQGQGGIIVQIEWRMLSQTNLLGFELQKAPNAPVSFQTIGFVARQGTPAGAQDYSAVDSSASLGTWYYRLKVQYLDSSTTYSGSIMIDVQTPLAFSLGQNYPNPFPNPANPGTTIRFSLPQASVVNITVHDMLGREVRTILNESRPAGAGTPPAVWDGRNKRGEPVASGVYIYRIRATSSNPGSSWSASETRKLVVLR